MNPTDFLKIFLRRHWLGLKHVCPRLMPGLKWSCLWAWMLGTSLLVMIPWLAGGAGFFDVNLDSLPTLFGQMLWLKPLSIGLMGFNGLACLLWTSGMLYMCVTHQCCWDAFTIFEDLDKKMLNWVVLAMIAPIGLVVAAILGGAGMVSLGVVLEAITWIGRKLIWFGQTLIQAPSSIAQKNQQFLENNPEEAARLLRKKIPQATQSHQPNRL